MDYVNICDMYVMVEILLGESPIGSSTGRKSKLKFTRLDFLP